ncbi:MAG: hypothetical protein AAB592_03290 [Patescibacteria group bacterium]
MPLPDSPLGFTTHSIDMMRAERLRPCLAQAVAAFRALSATSAFRQRVQKMLTGNAATDLNFADNVTITVVYNLFLLEQDGGRGEAMVDALWDENNIAHTTPKPLEIPSLPALTLYDIVDKELQLEGVANDAERTKHALRNALYFLIATDDRKFNSGSPSNPLGITKPDFVLHRFPFLKGVNLDSPRNKIELAFQILTIDQVTQFIAMMQMSEECDKLHPEDTAKLERFMAVVADYLALKIAVAIELIHGANAPLVFASCAKQYGDVRRSCITDPSNAADFFRSLERPDGFSMDAVGAVARGVGTAVLDAAVVRLPDLLRRSWRP